MNIFKFKENFKKGPTLFKRVRPFQIPGGLRENEQDAKVREQYLKSGVGKRYIKNRLKFYLSGQPRKIPAKI